MILSIDGLIGIAHAKIDITGITLITGPNGAGKSTIAQGLAAALTSQPLIRGIKNLNRLGAVVRTGHERAKVEIRNDKGHRSIVWPSNDVESEGEPPESSYFAAGTVHVLDVDDKTRAQMLIGVLKASPDWKDLETALSDAGLPDKAYTAVREVVEDKGWDAAHKHYKERGARLKGQWEAATHDNYGSDKGEKWLPEGWSEDLTKASVDTLEANVSRAKAKLENSIAGQAVDSEEIKRLTELADRDSELTEAEALLEEEISGCNSALQQAQAERDALPPAINMTGVACPYPECEGRFLQILTRPGAHELATVDHEDLSTEEVKSRRNAIAAADGQVANRRDALTTAEQKQDKSSLMLEEATEARAQLQDMTRDKATVTPEQVESARVAVEAAHDRHAIYLAKRNADRAHKGVKMNQDIVDLLAPDGLRKKKLAKRLGDFNKKMAPLSKKLEYPALRIDGDLNVWLGDRSYPLLSQGERFAARVIMQVAIAQIDESDMVVIDAAEVLVGSKLVGLLKMLKAAKIPTLLCVAVKGPEAPPDLEKSNLGVTYWIGADGPQRLEDALGAGSVLQAG